MMTSRRTSTDAAARAPKKAIRRDMSVRQVAHDFPRCRGVLVRYGEPADRSPFGHLEPLERFATRHKVPLDQLLQELSDATGVPVDQFGPTADRVHRPFLAAALGMTLTIGAGWGAWLLWLIGLGKDFQEASVAHVVAHGDAQLWGFIALFITGVALRWLPTATATRPASRLVSTSIFAGMLIGIGGGFAWAMRPTQWAWLGPFSGAALLAATVLMTGFLYRRIAPQLNKPWARAVLAAGLWWIVWAGFTLWLRTVHDSAGPDAYSIAQRNWNIELAVFGLATNAIYGFGLRLLPGMIGGSTKQRWAALAIALHNLGLLLLPLGHAAAQTTVELVATVCLSAGAVSFAAALPGLKRPKRFSNRPEQGAPGLSRFVQLAVFWLVIGLLLLLIGQSYSVATGNAIPHAWRGAARHALTVGFLTTLIMGVAQRLLPILEQRLLRWPQLVIPALILVGAGNTLRVTTEVATIVWPGAFLIMPFSSLMELAALALMAANCLRTMWPPPDPLLTTGRVRSESSVAVLLAEHPWLEDELIADGITYLARTRSVPRELTIASLSRSQRRSPDDLVQRINELLDQSA